MRWVARVCFSGAGAIGSSLTTLRPGRRHVGICSELNAIQCDHFKIAYYLVVGFLRLCSETVGFAMESARLRYSFAVYAVLRPYLVHAPDTMCWNASPVSHLVKVARILR